MSWNGKIVVMVVLIPANERHTESKQCSTIEEENRFNLKLRDESF